MNDFSTPRRMNAKALIIFLQKSFGQIISLIIISAYSILRADSIQKQILITVVSVGIIMAVSIIMAFSRYYFWKFHVENNKLVITHGFASKQTTSIPLSRVHTLRTKSGILYRLLGLRGITFDTLASDKEEVELILGEREWLALLCRVSIEENYDATNETAATSPAPPAEEHKTYIVSDADIIKGALCQNVFKGFAILVALLGALYDKISQFIDNTEELLLNYFNTQADGVVHSAGAYILFAAGIYLVVVILWVGKIMFRYCGMTLHISDNRLSVESGLLSRYTCRMARKKATVLTIKQNPLEKMAHCQTISILQAENVSGTEKGGNVIIYGSDYGSMLMSWWLGGSEIASEETLVSAKSGKGLVMRKLFPNLILATTISLIALYADFFVLPALAICSVYVAVIMYGSVMAWKHSRITLTEDFIRINCGRIAEIIKYIKYQDIESVAIRCSPFTSVTGRVSLRITTNAEIFSVYSLKLREAALIRNILLV